MAKAWMVTALLWIPSSALADATVKVELRGPDGKPAQGTVVLRKGDERHACTTTEGKCALTGVGGGLYSVRVEQEGKRPPKAKQVMIPPSGEVSLIVRGG